MHRAAQMIEHETIWNWADEMFVCPAMRFHLAPSYMKCAIALTRTSTRPEPTAILLLLNVLPESLDWRSAPVDPTTAPHGPSL
jgi:hypothetical protein